MPQRWAIRLAVEGDVRFLSHHDVMRAIERTAGRASLPLRYSQGFNPRPKLSLVCPRPVGVAALDDLLVLSLETDAEGKELLLRLNAHAPRGMRFARADLLSGSHTPRPVRAHLELPIRRERVPELGRRITVLGRTNCWVIEREVFVRRMKRRTARTIDLRPLVENIRVDGSTLHVSLVRWGQMWARPGEVLRLVGLDEQTDLAGMVRTKVEYAF